MKYTKELLAPIVARSFSIAEVMRHFGRRSLNGGSHAHIKRRIHLLGLDTSHFLGQGRNCGVAHKGGTAKIPWQEVLVNNRVGRKEDTMRLRRAMKEAGLPYQCKSCGLRGAWNGKTLVLQISHQNGDCTDNRKNNLAFECPNCHSQTDDFGGRGAGKHAQ